MKRTRRRRAGSLLAVLLAIVVLAGAAWWLLRPPAATVPAQPLAAAAAVTADRVDPANEGRRIVVSGVLHVGEGARDDQLGVRADAVVLMREVAMRQWTEHCDGDACSYALEWSAMPVDSHAFRVPAGHANPATLPFASHVFAARAVRLGAFEVDAEAAAKGMPALAHAVRLAELPPNLAATFRERDGVLYAGGDPAQPAAGDLRVSYRVVPAGPRKLSGVQRGTRLDSADGP